LAVGQPPATIGCSSLDPTAAVEEKQQA